MNNKLPNLTQTEHLSDEQMFGLMSDQPGTVTDPHLSVCVQCQCEFANLRTALADLRIATTNLAAAETPALVLRHTQSAPQRSFRRPIWAASLATAVALLCTVSVSVVRTRHGAPVTPVVVVTDPDQSVSDEALLDGIQTDLSTSIPPSLEPLAVPTAIDSTRSTH